MTLWRTINLNALGWIVVALALFAVPLTADAQGKGKRAQAAAKKYYGEGKKLYDGAKFEEALKKFQAAYDAKPHPVVLKSIAECKAALGDILGAIEILRKALDESDKAGKPDIEMRIEKMVAMLIPLEVTTAPSNAAISINGENFGDMSPATFKFNPGTYEVTLTLEGYEPITRSVTLTEGSSANISVDFAAEGVALDAEPGTDLMEATDEWDETPKDGLPAGFWISAAVTGVGLVSGAVFGAMALNAEDDFKADPTQAKADSGKAKAIVSDISFGVAAAGAIVGTIILIRHSKKESDDSTARLNIVPVAGNKTFGAAAVIAF